MKNLIFALIIVFSSITCYSQSNEWFPIGATWHYDAIEYCGGNPDLSGYIKMECIKDTIVNLKNVKMKTYGERNRKRR